MSTIPGLLQKGESVKSIAKGPYELGKSVITGVKSDPKGLIPLVQTTREIKAGNIGKAAFFAGLDATLVLPLLGSVGKAGSVAPLTVKGLGSSTRSGIAARNLGLVGVGGVKGAVQFPILATRTIAKPFVELAKLPVRVGKGSVGLVSKAPRLVKDPRWSVPISEGLPSATRLTSKSLTASRFRAMRNLKVRSKSLVTKGKTSVIKAKRVPKRLVTGSTKIGISPIKAPIDLSKRVIKGVSGTVDIGEGFVLGTKREVQRASLGLQKGLSSDLSLSNLRALGQSSRRSGGRLVKGGAGVVKEAFDLPIRRFLGGYISDTTFPLIHPFRTAKGLYRVGTGGVTLGSKDIGRFSTEAVQEFTSSSPYLTKTPFILRAGRFIGSGPRRFLPRKKIIPEVSRLDVSKLKIAGGAPVETPVRPQVDPIVKPKPDVPGEPRRTPSPRRTAPREPIPGEDPILPSRTPSPYRPSRPSRVEPGTVPFIPVRPLPLSPFLPVRPKVIEYVDPEVVSIPDFMDSPDLDVVTRTKTDLGKITKRLGKTDIATETVRPLESGGRGIIRPKTRTSVVPFEDSDLVLSPKTEPTFISKFEPKTDLKLETSTIVSPEIKPEPKPETEPEIKISLKTKIPIKLRTPFPLPGFGDGDSTRPTVILTTGVLPLNSGSVSPKVSRVTVDSVVSVAPKSHIGWKFDHWEGDVPEGQERTRELSIYMSGAKRVIAVFIEGKETERVSLELPEQSLIIPRVGISVDKVSHIRRPIDRKLAGLPKRIILGRRPVQSEVSRLRS